jgi:hypothetical protein
MQTGFALCLRYAYLHLMTILLCSQITVDWVLNAMSSAARKRFTEEEGPRAKLVDVVGRLTDEDDCGFVWADELPRCVWQSTLDWQTLSLSERRLAGQMT